MKTSFLFGGIVISLSQSMQIETISTPKPDDIVIDIRHPNESEKAPLDHLHNHCLTVPFFELPTYLDNLDPNRQYLLYCKQGIMSRLQAHTMRQQGFKKVALLELSDN
jgi:thiamine biosynthesis protein ThiI